MSEIADIFNTCDEIFSVFTKIKKVNFLFSVKRKKFNRFS